MQRPAKPWTPVRFRLPPPNRRLPTFHQASAGPAFRGDNGHVALQDAGSRSVSGDRQAGSKAATEAMVEAAERWVAQASAAPRWKRALRVLVDGGSLTVKSAAKDYGEWNLRETVRELARRGVRLAARPRSRSRSSAPSLCAPAWRCAIRCGRKAGRAPPSCSGSARTKSRAAPFSRAQAPKKT